MIQNVHLAGDSAEAQELVDPLVVRVRPTPEMKLQPCSQCNIKGNPHKRNLDIIPILYLFLLADGRMTIFNIRYTLLGHVQVFHLQLEQILSPAAGAHLEDERIPDVGHPLRHRRNQHLLELIHSEGHRFSVHLRIPLLRFLLHPGHIPFIGRFLNLAEEHQVIPERMEMNQYLPEGLFIQAALGPVPAFSIATRIQLCVFGIGGIEVFIYAELLKVRHHLQCKVCWFQTSLLPDNQVTLQLPRERKRLPEHPVTEAAHLVLLI